MLYVFLPFSQELKGLPLPVVLFYCFWFWTVEHRAFEAIHELIACMPVNIVNGGISIPR
jgi:hypothetical protein